VENGSSLWSHKLLAVLLAGYPSNNLHSLLSLLYGAAELFPSVESKNILSGADLFGRDASLAEALND
jgi:hypothetical protein